jgi:ELWxxDGT repeat protein
MKRLTGTNTLLILAFFLGYAPVLAQEPYPVKDIVDPMYLTAMGGSVYFRYDDGIHGSEFWKSDGTAAGTAMVKDINPGPGNSDPNEMFAVFGMLYFCANDGEHGWELWKSDGTEDGTVMIMDINPGSGDSYPREFQRIGNKLLFTAVDNIHGRELWALDLPPTYSCYLPLVLRCA